MNCKLPECFPVSMDFDHSNFHESVESSEEYDNGKVYKIGDQVISRGETYKMVEVAGSPGYAPERAGDKLWVKITDASLTSPPSSTPPPVSSSIISGPPSSTISGPPSPAPASGTPTTDSVSPAIISVPPVTKSSIFGSPPPAFESYVPPVFRTPAPPTCGSSTRLIAGSSQSKSTNSSYILYIIIAIIIIGLVSYLFSK